MKPAAEKLAEKLAGIEFSAPQIPVINNVDVKAESKGDDIKQALIRQLYSPVRWTETVQAMQQQGINSLIECGAGNVLAGLAKRISRDITCHVINEKQKLDELLQQL
jgi:[acyl-carrier-protein] S-malonyltransferase